MNILCVCVCASVYVSLFIFNGEIVLLSLSDIFSKNVQCKNKKRYSLFCSLTVLTEILTTFFNNSSFLFYHLFNHLPVLPNLEVPKVGVALPNRDTVALLEGRG